MTDSIVAKEYMTEAELADLSDRFMSVTWMENRKGLVVSRGGFQNDEEAIADHADYRAVVQVIEELIAACGPQEEKDALIEVECQAILTRPAQTRSLVSDYFHIYQDQEESDDD